MPTNDYSGWKYAPYTYEGAQQWYPDANNVGGYWGAAAPTMMYQGPNGQLSGQAPEGWEAYWRDAAAKDPTLWKSSWTETTTETKDYGDAGVFTYNYENENPYRWTIGESGIGQWENPNPNAVKLIDDADTIYFRPNQSVHTGGQPWYQTVGGGNALMGNFQNIGYSLGDTDTFGMSGYGSLDFDPTFKPVQVAPNLWGIKAADGTTRYVATMSGAQHDGMDQNTWLNDQRSDYAKIFEADAAKKLGINADSGIVLLPEDFDLQKEFSYKYHRPGEEDSDFGDFLPAILAIGALAFGMPAGLESIFSGLGGAAAGAGAGVADMGLWLAGADAATVGGLAGAMGGAGGMMSLADTAAMLGGAAAGGAGSSALGWGLAEEAAALGIGGQGTAGAGALGLEGAAAGGAMDMGVGLNEVAQGMGAGTGGTGSTIANSIGTELGFGAPEFSAVDPFSFDPSSLGNANFTGEEIRQWAQNAVDTVGKGMNPDVGMLDKIYGQISGYGNLTTNELAAMIEGGTSGAAGASLEALAGVGAGGGAEGLLSLITNATGGTNMSLNQLWENITNPSKWTASGLLDAAKIGTGLMSLFNNASAGRDIEKTAAGLAGDKLDRTKYREELLKSYTDPWGSAEAQASKRNLRQAAERKGAQRGIMPVHTELALQGELAKVLDERRRTLAHLAGAQFDPASMAAIQMGGLKDGTAATNRGLDSLLSGVGSVLEGMRGGGRMDPTDYWKWLFGGK